MEVEVRRSSRRLRSQISPAEREVQAKRIKLEKQKVQEAWERRPFIQYEGKVKYHTDMIDCAMICDNLL
ncbi:hypothetical protein NQ314_007467 [Rhamnusium bicolor]|uniref:Uncharacterized protein n=1 Tax=Rhamnusium bicolor TaxID=1586634 RepID=A0AAV8YLW8_9CUCU|nr:hypothetical protein NQ314_007467 [Rhamnusium bicolor]